MEGSPHYVLPRHQTENDRLDLLSHAIYGTIGAGWLSPVMDPGTVLDVGCGTGLWAYGISRRYTDAHVVGVDVEDFRDPGTPDNFEYRKVNVLHGLPFEDGAFDFTHQSLMVAAYPTTAFPTGVAELVRVTRPGGWIELVETLPAIDSTTGHAAWIYPEGAATRELWSYFTQLGRTVDQDTVGVIPERLERYLTEAGLLGVQKRTIKMPVGEWGSEQGAFQGRAGEMLTVSFRSLLVQLAPAFERIGLSPERCRDLVADFILEANELKSVLMVKLAFGQKPK